MLHISCNIGTRDLPDMYALSPRACGPWALGIHIRQITRAYVTTLTYLIHITLLVINSLGGGYACTYRERPLCS